MAENNLSLLSSLHRVVTPFIKVTIGEYTFGVYSKSKLDSSYDYQGLGIQFPNYVQSLQVKKINGKVNKYTLNLSYAITENNDPNFFEKVFSSVSKTRKMILSYGDVSMPSYLYREEETLITNISQQISVSSPVINYTISAVSNAFLSSAGVYNFPAEYNQPSVVIERLLRDNYYGLTEVFSGMRDINLVRTYNLIPHDDRAVHLKFKENMTVLEYLSYLVDCMKSYNTSNDSITQESVYVLNIIDQTSQMNFNDKGVLIFDGPYFKIVKNEHKNDAFDTYLIDVGFPTQNIITQFSIEQNEAYSILYDYQNKLNNVEYTQRINNLGQLENIYSPRISSNNNEHITNEEDKTWWTKVTQYPIKVTITLKGLLRPATLMSYVRLRVLFFGKKHSISGLYIITQQIDEVKYDGFSTTLSLTRVGSDELN